jgi:hypothetical protein
MANWSDALQSLASAGTAIGVAFAGWQLFLTHRQATTSFEDSVAREYRSIAQRLPVSALLGESLPEKEFAGAMDEFYHYIDLSNEQTFLRTKGRISWSTWSNWCDGIRTNFSKPAFSAAWEHIKLKAPESFQELRRLEAERFTSDPKDWR